MQDMFKGNVSMQDTHTQIMSSCKTLQFRKTCLLSLVGRHDLLKDMSSCLKMHFYYFYFLCFILLKTCLFPRRVLNTAPRHDFYSVICENYSQTKYETLTHTVYINSSVAILIKEMKNNFTQINPYIFCLFNFSSCTVHNATCNKNIYIRM